jgi:protein-L-isoaspartate(D-aspartate) O-methyltransferase
VVGIERVESLANTAAERLAALGYENVEIIAADGTLGYPALAPYDGILVAAAGPRIPSPLIEQLALNGRLIIPVGSSDSQLIKVVEKTPDRVEVTELTPVRFVPLIGEEGWD